MPRINRGPIVVDTGPLLIYLGYPLPQIRRCGDTRRDEVFRSLQEKVALDETLQERFETELNSYSSIVTTTLALGEAFRLRESSASRARY